MNVIDINCDVGEGLNNEAELLPFISSCNIACGGHAGDEASMLEVVLLAKKHKVKVGAHPSYPDKENFGRVSIPISEEDLVESIQKQLKNFITVVQQENVDLHHIKPHGALYNDSAKDRGLARTFLKAIAPYKASSLLYVPFASVIAAEALKQGFRINYEAFADRNYNNDRSLVSRKLPKALLNTPKEVLQHVLLIAKENKLKTIDGSIVTLKADTFCVHSDTPAALEIIRCLYQELPNHNLLIANV